MLTVMHWQLSNESSRAGAALADRHYSRKTVGATRFMPPGRKLVLVTPAGDAVWGTSWPYPQYVKHAWPGAWLCTIFRNESPHLSSDLIREAVAASRFVFGEPPAAGLITFIDAARVRHKRDPGRCFLRAGFQRAGTTAGGLLVLQLLPEAMPRPEAPSGRQLSLWLPA